MGDIASISAYNCTLDEWLIRCMYTRPGKLPQDQSGLLLERNFAAYSVYGPNGLFYSIFRIRDRRNVLGGFEATRSRSREARDSIHRGNGDIADTLSNLIRGNSPGDHLNTPTVSGKPCFQEPCIRVRWPWMIFLVAKTFDRTPGSGGLVEKHNREVDPINNP